MTSRRNTFGSIGAGTDEITLTAKTLKNPTDPTLKDFQNFIHTINDHEHKLKPRIARWKGSRKNYVRPDSPR